MVSFIKVGKQANDILKTDPEAKLSNKRDDKGEWRKLLNEELHSLHHTPNLITVIIFRIVTLPWHIARMEEGRSALKF